MMFYEIIYDTYFLFHVTQYEYGKTDNETININKTM